MSDADPPNIEVAHEKIGQLVADISDTAGVMVAQLNAAIAMAEAGDTVGLVYALRRSRAYWAAHIGIGRRAGSRRCRTLIRPPARG